MSESASRREELLDEVVDHVLEHGLIGLTLRPVAKAIGTSDRMLIYHLGSRDQLVAEVTTRACDRARDEIRALPPADGVREAVLSLWHAYQVEPLRGCLDVYVQAAATGLIGHEPYRSVVRAGNEQWVSAMREFLVRSGAAADRAARVVTMIDSALYGFLLDLITERPEELDRGVEDLAAAAETLATA